MPIFEPRSGREKRGGCANASSMLCTPKGCLPLGLLEKIVLEAIRYPHYLGWLVPLKQGLGFVDLEFQSQVTKPPADGIFSLQQLFKLMTWKLRFLEFWQFISGPSSISTQVLAIFSKKSDLKTLSQLVVVLVTSKRLPVPTALS